MVRYLLEKETHLEQVNFSTLLLGETPQNQYEHIDFQQKKRSETKWSSAERET